MSLYVEIGRKKLIMKWTTMDSTIVHIKYLRNCPNFIFLSLALQTTYT